MSVTDYLESLLNRLDLRATYLDKVSRRYSFARLSVFIVGLTTVIILVNRTYSTTTTPEAVFVCALLFLMIFLFLAHKHDQVEKGRHRLSIWQHIQEGHLARLKLDWEKLPCRGRSISPSHPYDKDLDITGQRSLLHLLDTTTMLSGLRRLESWLLDEPVYGEIPRRQAAVRALVKQRRFRDRLSLLGKLHAGKDGLFDYSVIVKRSRISEQYSLLNWRGKGVLATSLINITFIILALNGGASLWPYSFGLYIILYGTLIARIGRHIEHLFQVNRALSGLFSTLKWLKSYQHKLGGELDYLWIAIKDNENPEHYSKRLKRLDAAITFSQSDYMRLLVNSLLPYDLILMIIYTRTIKQLLPRVEKWIDMLAEIEALSALATYADFRQDWCTFPELITDNDASAVVKGAAIGHPLMDEQTRIPNDVGMSVGEVGVITGSNMSGKSTYLRSIGIATLMAWAGGPVCAKTFQISPVRLYTSMRIGDVLQDGKSTFYAEVERLSIIVNAVSNVARAPVLVLLDEILRGTNTKERLIGVHSIVRYLAGSQAMSFIATHDQEITQLAEESPKINNFHFREYLEDNRLVFEYLIHDGPSDTTNALLIMREAGLPVLLDSVT